MGSDAPLPSQWARLRPEAILNENRPVLNELNPYKRSKVEDCFATFGLGQVLDWLGTGSGG